MRKFLLIILCTLSIVAFCLAGCDGCGCKHDYGGWVTLVGSSCDQTTLMRACKKCGEEDYKVLEGDGHDYVIVYTQEATCSSVGYKVEKCADCKDMVTTVIPAKQHIFSVSVVPPTCEVDGKEVTTCKNCDFREEKVNASKVGHDYQVESTMYKECGQPYVIKSECKNCSNVIYESSDQIATHVYQSVESKEATCVESGFVLYECIKCSDKYTETSEKTGHKLESKTINPTCDLEGRIVSYCINPGCQYVETLSELPQIPHLMTVIYIGKVEMYYSYDGIVLYSDFECTKLITAAKCHQFADVDVHFRCDSGCGLEVSLIEHEIVSKNTATCTQPGVLMLYCKQCGYEKSSTEVSARGHDDSGIEYFCKVDEALTAEYQNLSGDISKFVCYKCKNCNEYIFATAHEESCEDEDVTCLNPQVCLVCESVIKSIEHVAPKYTCVSQKNDGFYYCTLCKVQKLGEITPHMAVDGIATCKISNNLSEEFYLLTGQRKEISYKCVDCNTFVEVTPHVKSCKDEDVTCANPQVCLECGSLIKSKSHEAPTLKCVSSHNDDSYYCKNCDSYPMGKLISHNYLYSVEKISATCTTNECTLSGCVCGKVDEAGYIEVANTKIGHKLSGFVANDVKDCQLGHVLVVSTPYCENENCQLNFSSILMENNKVYCLDVYNYLNAGGYLDDLLFDDNIGRAGDKLVKSLIMCCSSTNYRYVSEQHNFKNVAYVTEDYLLNGETCLYVPSTCSVNGSAVTECNKCSMLAYREGCLPLNPDNHQSELLPCDEHCVDCVPEGKLCNLSMEIVVYDENGKFVVSEVLTGEYLISRVEEIVIDGEKAYMFTDAHVSTMEGLQYFTTAEAAKEQDYKYEYDWDNLILYLNAENKIVVYKNL